jgi:hypothetical protein
MFPRNSFEFLSIGEKLTVTNPRLHHANVYRSLIVIGFGDAKDDICLQTHTKMDKLQNLKHPQLNDVLVTEYLQYHIKSSREGNLLHNVFSSHGTDIREFLVPLELF